MPKLPNPDPYLSTAAIPPCQSLPRFGHFLQLLFEPDSVRTTGLSFISNLVAITIVQASTSTVPVLVASCLRSFLLHHLLAERVDRSRNLFFNQLSSVSQSSHQQQLATCDWPILLPLELVLVRALVLVFRHSLDDLDANYFRDYQLVHTKFYCSSFSTSLNFRPKLVVCEQQLVRTK